MNRHEYNFKAFQSISTEEESGIYALGFNRFLIDMIKSGSDISSKVSKEDLAKMHAFNIMILSSSVGAMLSKPELSFGFKDDETYSISYRNYNVTDYLTLIRFKESELLYTKNNNTEALIIKQFITLLNHDSIIPYSPIELIEWLLGDLMFGIILYEEDESYYYKRIYCPEFNNVVLAKDREVLSVHDFYKTGHYRLRDNRKKSFVTGYKVATKKCQKSEVFKTTSKWAVLDSDVDFSSNPFSDIMDSIMVTKRPKLALVSN